MVGQVDSRKVCWKSKAAVILVTMPRPPCCKVLTLTALRRLGARCGPWPVSLKGDCRAILLSLPDAEVLRSTLEGEATDDSASVDGGTSSLQREIQTYGVYEQRFHLEVVSQPSNVASA